MKIIQENPGAGSFSFLLTNENPSQNLRRPMRISLFFPVQIPELSCDPYGCRVIQRLLEKAGTDHSASPDQWESFSKIYADQWANAFFSCADPRVELWSVRLPRYPATVGEGGDPFSFLLTNENPS
jgi:hypothetical protein